MESTKNETIQLSLFGIQIKSKEYYIKRYIQEVFEAFVSIMLIRYAMGKDLPITALIKASLIIGLVTLLLEEYNHDFKENIVQGLTFSVGASLIGRFS